jgi:hypothetical protein
MHHDSTIRNEGLDQPKKVSKSLPKPLKSRFLSHDRDKFQDTSHNIIYTEQIPYSNFNVHSLKQSFSRKRNLNKILNKPDKIFDTNNNFNFFSNLDKLKKNNNIYEIKKLNTNNFHKSKNLVNNTHMSRRESYNNKKKMLKNQSYFDSLILQIINISLQFYTNQYIYTKVIDAHKVYNNVIEKLINFNILDCLEMPPKQKPLLNPKPITDKQTKRQERSDDDDLSSSDSWSNDFKKTKTSDTDSSTSSRVNPGVNKNVTTDSDSLDSEIKTRKKYTLKTSEEKAEIREKKQLKLETKNNITLKNQLHR